MLFIQVTLVLVFLSSSYAYLSHRINNRQISLLAKKRGGNESKSPKGFKKAPVLPSQDDTSATATDVSLLDLVPATSEEEPADADAVFKKYGISSGGESAQSGTSKKQKGTAVKKEYNENAPFGQSTMAGIPYQTQTKIENALLVAVFGMLTFLISCGIAISLKAFQIVSPSVQISSEVDSVIVNFLSPAFTPALGVFLLCSTTYGLFKFAQLSNSQTVYKE
jgi:hypothetical protein